MRTLKPETFTSETLADCSLPARWTFAGLWTYCDDDGRGRADPRLVKAAIWPLDDDVTSKDVAAYLDELEAQVLICRYEAQGKVYLHVVNFAEHQKPNRPGPSKLPACPRTTHGGLTESSLSPHEGRTLDAGMPHATPVSPEQAQEPGDRAAHGPIHDESAGQPSFSEDSVSPHGAVNPTSFTNTPTPTPLRTEVEVDGDVDGEGEKTTPAKPPRDDVERLCSHLADRIEGNGSKRPAITQKWRDAARLMLDSDHRAEDQVRTAIDWCQDDEFWMRNVMSMPTLRKQYDRLRLAAQQQRGSAAKPAASKQINFSDEEYTSGWG